MVRDRFSTLCRPAALAACILAAVVCAAGDAIAQGLKDVQTADTPLVLKAQGSFFVGGEKVEQTRAEVGDLAPGGSIAVNQMYVRYMVPQGGDGNVPVVMVHGATLTGKSWETTPDGRMGWDEYFVRRGHPVYVPDQVGRGRSGFNQAVFNNVRAGSTPPANQPVWLRFSDASVWPNFRFGLTAGQPFPDTQFPVAAIDELAKQGVPDVSFGGIPTPSPTIKALSDLAGQLNGAVLMGHSQSGSFPLAAALLNPAVAKGLVLVEPGSCPASYTTEQIAALAKVPILVVFGDHRETPTGIPALPTWQTRFEACQALIGRIMSAGGQAEMLAPPDRGIRGNSHMIMQDKNHLQIADLILQWVDARVSKRIASFTASARQGAAPLAPLVLPAGFRAEVFAENVDNARTMALGPQGTVFVGSRTAGKVHAVVDSNGDHKTDRVVLIASGLDQPNGIALRNGALYVATASRLLRLDDIEKHLDAPPTPVTLRNDLPNPKAGHTWKFIAFGPDDMLYISIGAPCNVCESPSMVSAIIRMKPDGSGTEVFAEGVRNSVGFDWHPVTRELWFTDNGRDGLGDDVPGDELNVAPKAGLHFGFPFCHQGDVADPQFGAQRACSTTEPPALTLGAHVAAIGFTFYTGSMFPATYTNAAIIAEHGSWNRTTPSGYRVMVARTDGRRVTGYEPLVDGFLPGAGSGAPGGRGAGSAAIGRPADVLQMPDGSILISDDAGHRLIRVSYGR